MINNNSIVSVGISNNTSNTQLGKLVSYKYYAPTGNGQIEVVIEPFNDEFDKKITNLLASKIGDLISVSIEHGPADEDHAVFLQGIEFSTSNYQGPYIFDRIVITGNKP